LKEYFVHVFRAVCGYFALVEYFLHVLRVVRGCFVPVGGNRFLSGRGVAYVSEYYYIATNFKIDAYEKICFYGNGFIACCNLGSTECNHE
jgi:hypothetical protein